MSVPSPALTVHAGRLVRHGVPHRILAGSMHPFRVHPGLWHDRMRRLVDLGLNTVDLYVAWNAHQPAEDTAPDFTGANDLERFLQIAQDEGLDAIVRPGPYICAEWRNGGLPVWLTGRGIPLRCTDRRYLDAVARWFDVLLPRLVPLQAGAGGPIVAWQAENEFGSYGDDSDYMAACVRMLRDRGVTELLTTADGPTAAMTDTGATPDALMALNFGSDPAAARAHHDARRPDEPFLCGEFWNGWFDHWDGPHHVRAADGVARTVAEILQDGGSVSLYMAHGGSNPGLGAGANDVDGAVRPVTQSYDSDAPVAEDGTLTAKFEALRRVFGRTTPPRSIPPRLLTGQTAPLTPGRPLAAWTGPSRQVTLPCATDAAGVVTDLVRFDADVVLPHADTVVSLHDVRDTAHVFLNGRFLGSCDGEGAFPVHGGGAARLTVIAEVRGRIGYGPRLGEHKGLVGPVLVDGRRQVQWATMTPIPVETWTMPTLDAAVGATADHAAVVPTDAGDAPFAPRFARAVLHVVEPADAHLAFCGTGRGLAWVGDTLMGRYDEAGPTRTMYVPGPLLRAGANTVTVLEFSRLDAAARVEVRERADLGPAEEFIEQF